MITASQDSILGSYVTFEPNAFDGKDNQYKNAQYHDKTGRFVPYSVKSKGKIITEPAVGYDSPDLEVYHIPKQTKKTALIPPYDYPVDGVQITMISLAYPIIRDQKFLGISGVDISLDTIRKYLKNIYILEGSVKITFVASNDYILYDGFSSGNKETIWDHKKDENIRKARTLVQKLTNQDSHYFYVYVPIRLVKDSEPWTLRIAYPMQEITKDIGFIFWMSLGLGILGILFATGASIWIFRRLVDSRLRVLQEFANEVAAGNLAAKLPPFEDDEIGLLVSALAEMTSNLRYILSVAQSSGIELSKTASNMEGTIVELSDLAQNQAASSEEASATVEELNASSETINNNVEQAVTNTKSIHEALLRIQNLMGEITGEVEAFGKIAIQANEKAEEGKNMAGITSKAIAEIQDKSQSIAEFSEVISGISEKTSLLALNAAIEAARAGESGRGFAVVAEEISKLAAQAADSVSQINQLTEEAQESIENGGAQVRKLLDVLKEITGEVSVISERHKK